jgi:hypothetical protein
MTSPAAQCPWCSAELPAGAVTCPSCGAALTPTPSAQAGIPGLTEVPPELVRYAEQVKANRKRPSILKMIFSDTDIPTVDDAPPPSDADALRPPSAAVKAEMDRIENEAAASAVAAGGGTDPFAEIEPPTAEPTAAATTAEPTSVGPTMGEEAAAEPPSASQSGAEPLPQPLPQPEARA